MNMGLLYAAAVAEKKKQFIIDRLNKRNIFQTQQGKSLYEADYDELKYELVLSEFKDIDIANQENGWF